VTQKIPADFPSTDRDISTPEDVRLGRIPSAFFSSYLETRLLCLQPERRGLYRLREYILNNRGTEESRAGCER